MKSRILYHGSSVIVKKPDLYAGNPIHDFGRAFYLTTNKLQAVKWSRHKMHKDRVLDKIEPYKFLVSEFSFNENNLNKLRVKEFAKPDVDWLNYIIKSRSNLEFAMNNDYDLIIGPVIDGMRSWVTLELYSKKVISFEETIRRIKPENLKDQWAFKSKKAIDFLEYRGVIDETN